MRAIDTNVVIRFLTADNAEQARAARTIIQAGDIFISTSVLLECEWVLRSGYGFSADEIATGMTGLAGLPRLTVEDPALLAQAIDWMREGMDFADALHLTKAQHCTVFLTFDRKFVKAARGRGGVPVEAP